MNRTDCMHAYVCVCVCVVYVYVDGLEASLRRSTGYSFSFSSSYPRRVMGIEILVL